MKRLSRKISLQFFIFVLAVLVVLIVLLSVIFVKAATDEYTNYLESKKQAVYRWFIDLRRDFKSYVDGYSMEGFIDNNLDLLVEKGESTVILRNRPGLPQDSLNDMSSAGNGFKMVNSQLIYYSTMISDEIPYIVGITFDSAEIESLSNFLGQDAIAFMLMDEHFVIPKEFSDSGLYVRTVLDEESWSKEIPFTVSEVRPAFSFLSSGSLFLVDKVSIGGATIYVLQSEGLLVLLKNRVLPILILVVVGVFAFSFLLSLSLNSYISRALSELLKGFESIKKGYFSRVTLKSDDELGEIASGLNDTMVFIERTLDRLKNSNELMRKVSREAQQASKMKSEFLANMSHEMRTPMNAILGFTELLMSDEGSLERLKYLKTIYRSGEHLLSLINDVLDLSKIEAARLELFIAPYNPSKLVKEIVETYLPMAYSKGLHLAYSLTENVPDFVDGDEFRVRQVLTNLVSNGLKFTNQGYVSIIVNYDASNLTYVVQDTGTGVSADQIDKIFEPFTQADGTMSRKFGGTGLGLTITKRIVELMNGVIRFESKINEGSKVTVKIPSPLSKEAPKEKVRPEQVKSGKIILASPSEDFSTIVGAMLKRNGIQFEVIKNLKDTARAIREFGASLVIMDMPTEKSEVFEALEELGGSVVIGVISSSGGEMEVGEWVQEVIQKPVKEEELIGKIHEYIDFTPVGIEETRVLVVEDNEANQLLIKKILEKAGYLVNIASNGLEATELVRRERYALILMDMQMPVMDGYEATRILRDEGYKMPIVALTAHTMQGDEERSISAGCDGFLGKPVKQTDLLETVRYYTGIYGKTGKKREILTLNIADGGGNRNPSEEKIEIFAKEMGLTLEEASDMFEEYGKHIGKTIELIRSLLQRGDLESLAREGHSLKGSGRMYGVEEISELGSKLEIAAKNLRKTDVSDILSQLEKIRRKLW